LGGHLPATFEDQRPVQNRIDLHFIARTIVLCLAGLVLALPATAATRDPVPLPHLRPGVHNAAATGNDGPAAAISRQPAFRFNPNSPFNQRQQEILANVSAYFNSFRLMEGQFIQFGPNGDQSEGVFFLNRPGKIRFHFKPPARLDVISDGSSVAIKDGKTGTQDLYPLSKTPLRYLLADHIDLTSDIVSSVKEETDLVSVVIVQKSAFADGKLTMIFDRKTYELRQWVVTDAQGLNTSVAIFNTTTGKPQDPGLFRISIASN
jgi:outer membrane lipoprotein-sorting protein